MIPSMILGCELLNGRKTMFEFFDLMISSAALSFASPNMSMALCIISMVKASFPENVGSSFVYVSCAYEHWMRLRLKAALDQLARAVYC